MNTELIKLIKSVKKNINEISLGTGINKNVVSRHITGKTNINTATLKKYAEFLDIPLSQLIDKNSNKYKIINYENKPSK